MKKPITIGVLALSFFAFSCKSKKETIAVSEASNKDVVLTSCTIDFYSKGSGINRSAYAKIDSIIEAEKKRCNFKTTLAKYGREGERQLCITNIPSDCSTTIEALINSFKKNDLIRVTANSECRN